eukprot:gene31367-64399_t
MIEQQHAAFAAALSALAAGIQSRDIALARLAAGRGNAQWAAPAHADACALPATPDTPATPSDGTDWAAGIPPPAEGCGAMSQVLLADYSPMRGAAMRHLRGRAGSAAAAVARCAVEGAHDGLAMDALAVTLQRLFADLDTDGSGELSLSEFRQLYLKQVRKDWFEALMKLIDQS